VKSGSEIEIDVAGKFLYVSNRTDGVAEGNVGAYAISQVDGKLTPIEHHQTRGKTPRQFSLSPDGKLLVVGNQGVRSPIFRANGRARIASVVARRSWGRCMAPVSGQ
jgi:6-phosphogluconolactonase (cycloisomerase 2 family)